ncbi:MAG: cation transporter [Firmicutes bacterium]|nr:cation transporter [Bacillota bacterium]
MIKTVLSIDGMMCSMCEAHVCDAIRNNLTVKKVSANHKKGSCEIISEASLNQDSLKKALDDIGYRLLSSSEEPYEKKKFLGIFG